MLRNVVRAAAAAAVLALVPLSTAKAIVCTPGAFNFCFTFTFDASSAKVVFESGNGVLTGFGIGGYTGIGGSGVQSSQGAFSIGNAQNCNAGNFNPVLCATSNNGVNGGVSPVGSVTLIFSSTGQPGPIGTVHIQQANGPNCSLWINSNGQIISGSTENCTTTTPEPASAALIATGLLGLGGGLIRRRRKNKNS